jgi:hypothetical protein
MNILNAFPSKSLSAPDLQGRPVVVTISHVEMEEVGRAREKKPVIYFRGKHKGLICNRTNARAIAAIAASSLTEDWEGVAITLYPTQTEFSGETVECIRIKPVTPAARRVVPAPIVVPPPVGEDPLDDAIPF